MCYWENEHLEEDEKNMVEISRIYGKEIGRIFSPRGAFPYNLVQCIIWLCSVPPFSDMFEVSSF